MSRRSLAMRSQSTSPDVSVIIPTFRRPQQLLRLLAQAREGHDFHPALGFLGHRVSQRLNERLRFLRYRGGEYFRPHTDGCYVTPAGDEIFYLTVHLYLNGNGEQSQHESKQVKDGRNPIHDQISANSTQPAQLPQHR